VNQEQDRGDGFPGKKRAGGVSQDYYTSIDLTFKQGGSSAYNQTKANKPGCGKEGRIITMNVRYSSMGADGPDQSIAVPVLVEYYVRGDGKKASRVMYDWAAADVHFLSTVYNKIKDVFDMETKYVKGYGTYAKSDRLGVDDFIPARQFGLLLQANTEVMSELREQLCITERPVHVFNLEESDDDDTE
jgi:hypothetical protein